MAIQVEKIKEDEWVVSVAYPDAEGDISGSGKSRYDALEDARRQVLDKLKNLIDVRSQLDTKIYLELESRYGNDDLVCVCSGGDWWKSCCGKV